jgi:hypothetical protein
MLGNEADGLEVRHNFRHVIENYQNPSFTLGYELARARLYFSDISNSRSWRDATEELLKSA